MEKLPQVVDTVLYVDKISGHWFCGLILVGGRRVMKHDPEASGLTKVAVAHRRQPRQWMS